MSDLTTRILHALARPSYTPVKPKVLAKRMGLTDADYPEFRRTLRELVLSYFEAYYNVAREKTLRGYTLPINLAALDRHAWMIRDDGLDEVANALDRARKFPLITAKMANRLCPVDPRTYESGLQGSVATGLFQPKDRS